MGVSGGGTASNWTLCGPSLFSVIREMSTSGILIWRGLKRTAFNVFVSLMTRSEVVLQTLVYLPFKNLTGLEDRKRFTENLEAMDLDLWTLPVSIWMWRWLLARISLFYSFALKGSRFSLISKVSRIFVMCYTAALSPHNRIWHLRRHWTGGITRVFSHVREN